MPTTIGVQVTQFAAATDLTLELLLAGTLLNTGGDAITHVTNGYFTCSVAETIASVDYVAIVKKAGVAIGEDVLRSGETVVGAGGNGGGITVVPLAGVVESRVNGTTINVFSGETPTIAMAVVDAEGNAVDVSALTLELAIETRYGADVATIADAFITKVDNTISFVVPALASANEGMYQWSLRKTSDDTVLIHGPWIVTYAASVG